MMVKVAGALCLVLAAGHTLLGSRSILPRLRKEALPASPLGGPSSTEVALAFTWYFVTIAVVAIAILLFAIAGHRHSVERSLVLQIVAGIFAAATLMAVCLSRGRLRSLIRSPVVGFAAVAVLCALSA